ncbi:venom allergen-like (VAL) 4 protein [Schistosoma japonicum]|nr:venom allergen-like (VAL) 4 protein [Schistosoma japonicum]
MIKTILASCLILLFTSQYVETRLPLELEQIYKFHKKVRKGLLNCKIPGQPPARFLEKLMVWNTTSEIGCGFKKCERNYIIVCNYAPGDSDGRPYEAKPQSACELPKL